MKRISLFVPIDYYPRKVFYLEICLYKKGNFVGPGSLCYPILEGMLIVTGISNNNLCLTFFNREYPIQAAKGSKSYIWKDGIGDIHSK